MVISPACHISFRGICFPKKKIQGPRAWKEESCLNKTSPWTLRGRGKFCFFDVATWKMAGPQVPFISKKNRLEWSFEGLLKENDGSMNTLNCFRLIFVHHPRPPFQTIQAKQRLGAFLDLIYRLQVQQCLIKQGPSKDLDRQMGSCFPRGISHRFCFPNNSGIPHQRCLGPRNAQVPAFQKKNRADWFLLSFNKPFFKTYKKESLGSMKS